ncbi:FAD-dependent oxidoreductase [Pyxidicoccus fallax]|uniref:long-chain-alcohol oxidase n=1 Tax=Pyxidicoccus fallax TaxID=394095 RepID=A0A848LJ76_9BACT|nr:FAD-dependent oxidoreductase [Pyxidicoccus fallax]NMO17795.1 FAD-dependent oxidoreductase [Pyxidicoccus fallax]NPC80121.1 FAD-dependent oxidoreductase [Pyxidicoccus fallax]
MSVPLSDTQLVTLRAICDTAVPRIDRADDPDGFWRRRATEVGADQALLMVLAGMPPEQRAGMLQLLDILAEQDFVRLSQPSREQVLTNLSLASREAAVGIGALVTLAIFFAYGLPDATGQNPAWKTFGYPGPQQVPAPAEPKPLEPLTPLGDMTLTVDVVVVGSGAGGGLIAGRLARAGLKVIVLEAGRYLREADFHQLEVPAYQQLYWRGGPTPTADMNVSLMAGACLGGGTTVNWTNCLRMKPWVREQWASEFGLEDVATEAFDRHLDAVWRELSVNDRCSELNRPQEAMQRGAQTLGWNFIRAHRNWDPERHDPARAGYMGFGDASGAKRSTTKTYLRQAADHGAEILVGCFVERVLVEGGRAAGVEARWTAADGSRAARVTVRAPRVVVAAGALESPGILLRSGIGGPAVGNYLRLHPCTAMMGDYGTDMQAWWGAPHAGLVDQFANVQDGYGFLVEGVQYTTALGASAVPFTSGAEHKQLMADYRNVATFIGLIRDHGHGRVTLDANGMTVPWYDLTDPVDVRNMHRALEAQARLHHAAGARRIVMLAQGLPTWRVGDDFDAFVARLRRVPLRAGGARLFAAHQMGTCRMGTNPATSVANPRGELHDTPGVWMGDASAFPTPSGTNPMISIMALASRTAEHIAQAAGVRTSLTEGVPA